MNAHDLDRDEQNSPISEYEQLEQEHRATLEALRLLAEGVRIVTRQMKQYQNYHDDNDSVASGTSDATPMLRCRTFSNGTVSVCSVVSDDDKRVDDLSYSLDGVVGADLLGLSQAAQMVNEHARLASQEASMLTDDMAHAALAAHEAQERAIKAEKAAMRLHRENVALQQQLDQLLIERKVLAKEIKSMRRENAELKKYEQDSKRQEMMLALEQHVRGALLVHEKQLAAANRNKRAESWDYADVVPTDKAEASDDAPEIGATPETQAEPPAAFVVIAPPAEKPKSRFVATRSVGFGGAGLAGYGYKFNRPKLPSLVTKAANTIEEVMETPTSATVATEQTTPDVSAPDENGNKENVSKEMRFSRAGRNIMGELTSASSTFSNFFTSLGTKESAGEPEPAAVGQSWLSRELESANAAHLTIDCRVPPSVVMDAPSIPSPFADDSPIAAAAASSSAAASTNNRHRHAAAERLIECDEKVLRSLSMPEEEPQIHDRLSTIPYSSGSGLYEA